MLRNALYLRSSLNRLSNRVRRSGHVLTYVNLNDDVYLNIEYRNRCFVPDNTFCPYLSVGMNHHRWGTLKTLFFVLLNQFHKYSTFLPLVF